MSSKHKPRLGEHIERRSGWLDEWPGLKGDRTGGEGRHKGWLQAGGEGRKEGSAGSEVRYDCEGKVGRKEEKARWSGARGGVKGRGGKMRSEGEP